MIMQLEKYTQLIFCELPITFGGSSAFYRQNVNSEDCIFIAICHALKDLKNH